MAPKFSRASTFDERSRSRSPHVATSLKSSQPSGGSTLSCVAVGRGAANQCSELPMVDHGNSDIMVDNNLKLTPVAHQPWSYTIYRLVYPNDSQDPNYDPGLEGHINSLVNGMMYNKGGRKFTMSEITTAVANAVKEYEELQADLNRRNFDNDDAVLVNRLKKDTSEPALETPAKNLGPRLDEAQASNQEGEGDLGDSGERAAMPVIARLGKFKSDGSEES
eukprot:s46_g7.t1